MKYVKSLDQQKSIFILIKVNSNYFYCSKHTSYFSNIEFIYWQNKNMCRIQKQDRDSIPVNTFT